MTTAIGFRDPRAVLARHQLAPKRRFSQNFLVSERAVREIVRAVAAAPGELVVELGAGLGTLTAGLLDSGARVIAIERDRDMLRVLQEELVPHGLVLREGDASELDYAALAQEHGGTLRVVGNIPYALTGAILRNVVQAGEAVSSAVLMVQREVRDRLSAAPGTAAYGALTVFVTAAFSVETVLKLPPNAFVPPPNVHSAVVRLERRAQPLAQETDSFARTVRAAFQSRRKTLRNALATAWPTASIEPALAEAGIDPQLRGETLGPAAFAVLAAALERHAGPAASG